MSKIETYLEISLIELPINHNTITFYYSQTVKHFEVHSKQHDLSYFSTIDYKADTDRMNPIPLSQPIRLEYVRIVSKDENDDDDDGGGGGAICSYIK